MKRNKNICRNVHFTRMEGTMEVCMYCDKIIKDNAKKEDKNTEKVKKEVEESGTLL